MAMTLSDQYRRYVAERRANRRDTWLDGLPYFVAPVVMGFAFEAILPFAPNDPWFVYMGLIISAVAVMWTRIDPSMYIQSETDWLDEKQEFESLRAELVTLDRGSSERPLA
jgi:hypothetical protein